MANIFFKQDGNFTRKLPMGSVSTPGIVESPGTLYLGGSREIPPPTDNTALAPGQFNNASRVLPPTPSPHTPPQPSPKQNAPIPQAPPKIDPYTAYSMLLMKELKKAQGGNDNAELLNRQRELQRESIRLAEGQGVQTSLPGMKGGMSPEQYGSVRQAQVNALSPGIDSVQFELKKLENKRKDIIEQLQFAQKSGDTAREMELKAKAFDLDERKLAETIRSNKATEGINRQKAKETDLKETAAEKNALGFYLRGKDALDTISTLEEEIQNKDLGGQYALQYLPNPLQSKDNQIYRQLQRQFTEARLRKESGAAIPSDEYEKDAQTYFAQPGDAKETLERKRSARNTVLESLKIGAGNAYKNYYGSAGENLPKQETTNNSQVIPKGTDGTSYGFPGYVSDGKQWVLK